MTIPNFGKLIWDWLGRWETVFSLLAMIFSGIAAVQLLIQRRRQREFIKSTCQASSFAECAESLEGIQSEKPMALAISVSSRNPSIIRDVKTFLDTKKWHMDIDTIEMVDIGRGNEEKKPVIDVENFLKLLREKRAFYDINGVTELHLFVLAPVSLAVFIGAVFDHWKPVKIYQKRLTPTPPLYEYWGILTKHG